MAEGFFRFAFSRARGKKARRRGESSRVGGSAIDRHVRVIHIGAIDAGLGSATAKDVYRYV